MQEYPIKRGCKEGYQERISEGLKKYFGIEPERDNEKYFITFGSFKRLEAYAGEKSTFIVDTVSDIGIFDRMSEEEANEIVLDTNRRFRQYLEHVTGYTTKERKKKAEQAMKKS